MVKCDKCSKVLNKKSPGLQCSKCSKWTHGSCANLSTDQLSTLFVTEAAEWKCKGCVGNTKSKRMSFVMPDPEEDDNTDTEPLITAQATQNMLSEIRRDVRTEVREAIRNELQSELQSVLQFYSDKIDEFEQKMREYGNRCTEFKNTCKNLSLKNEVLEQKINTLEQKQLRNVIEIFGVKETEQEDVNAISENICVKLQKNTEDILTTFRKKTNRTGAAQNKQLPIVVTLRDGCSEQWLETAKTAKLCARDIGIDSESKIFIREALTPRNSFLRWKAKTELKDTGNCKYVWTNQGQVLVRKIERGKAYPIMCENDIERIAKLIEKPK